MSQQKKTSMIGFLFHETISMGFPCSSVLLPKRKQASNLVHVSRYWSKTTASIVTNVVEKNTRINDVQNNYGNVLLLHTNIGLPAVSIVRWICARAHLVQSHNSFTIPMWILLILRSLPFSVVSLHFSSPYFMHCHLLNAGVSCCYFSLSLLFRFTLNLSLEKNSALRCSEFFNINSHTSIKLINHTTDEHIHSFIRRDTTTTANISIGTSVYFVWMKRSANSEWNE